MINCLQRVNQIETLTYSNNGGHSFDKPCNPTEMRRGLVMHLKSLNFPYIAIER